MPFTYYIKNAERNIHRERKKGHYREVLRWEIFMEQELRFGLDLGRIASKSFDL